MFQYFNQVSNNTETTLIDVRSFKWVLALLGMLLTSTVSAEMIIIQPGGGNPLDHGWELNHISGLDPLSETDPQTMAVNDGGINAWHIDTNSSAFVYQINSDDMDFDDQPGSMWKLSALVRIPEVNDRIDLGMLVDVYIDKDDEGHLIDHYYRMLFGTDPTGKPEVVLQGSRRGPYVFEDTGYHLYEMISRPDSKADGGQLISLYVDGVLLEDNYIGTHSTRLGMDQVRFGGEHRGTSGSTANFAYVGFEIGDDLVPGIPEPASGLMIVSAATGLLFTRQRNANTI